MGTAAEGLQSRTRTSQGVVKTPYSGQVDLGGKPQHKSNYSFDITLPVIVEPEDQTARTVPQREGEAGEVRIVGNLVFRTETGVKIERLSGILGRACVQNAGEVRELVRQDGLLSGEDVPCTNGLGGGGE